MLYLTRLIGRNLEIMRRFFGIVLAVFSTLIFVSYLSGTTNASASKILNGIYKCSGDTKYTDADDGTATPMYFYFTPDHKVKYACPEVTSSSDSDTTWYGEAGLGTWKYIGDGTYLMKLDDVYDSQHYEYYLAIRGNHINFQDSKDHPKYSLGSDFKAEKLDMSQSDFDELFNESKQSDKEGIADNGTTKPYDYRTFDSRFVKLS